MWVRVMEQPDGLPELNVRVLNVLASSDIKLLIISCHIDDVNM